MEEIISEISSLKKRCKLFDLAERLGNNALFIRYNLTLNKGNSVAYRTKNQPQYIIILNGLIFGDNTELRIFDKSLVEVEVSQVLDDCSEEIADFIIYNIDAFSL